MRVDVLKTSRPLYIGRGKNEGKKTHTISGGETTNIKFDLKRGKDDRA